MEKIEFFINPDVSLVFDVPEGTVRRHTADGIARTAPPSIEQGTPGGLQHKRSFGDMCRYYTFIQGLDSGLNKTEAFVRSNLSFDEKNKFYVQREIFEPLTSEMSSKGKTYTDLPPLDFEENDMEIAILNLDFVRRHVRELIDRARSEGKIPLRTLNT